MMDSKSSEESLEYGSEYEFSIDSNGKKKYKLKLTEE